MAYRNLRGFLDRLEELGELQRVHVEVDPQLEIAEITDRVSKSRSGNKALLFESFKGSAFPVVTNMFGSLRRVCLALEIGDLQDLTRRMEGLFSEIPAHSAAAKLSALPDLSGFSRFAPTAKFHRAPARNTISSSLIPSTGSTSSRLPPTSTL